MRNGSAAKRARQERALARLVEERKQVAVRITDIQQQLHLFYEKVSKKLKELKLGKGDFDRVALNLLSERDRWLVAELDRMEQRRRYLRVQHHVLATKFGGSAVHDYELLKDY